MRRCRPLLGTFVEIECDRAEAIDAGFAAIARIHALMSAHERDSELSRINCSAHLGAVGVGAETAAVIARALHWSRLSGGAFDVVRAGVRALSDKRLPKHQDQPRPGSGADWTAVRVDGRRVSLDCPACFDLGGIAKGYAVDAAVVAMQRHGATSGLVNAGGDLRVFGLADWPVTIVEPLTRAPLLRIDLSNSALATSAGLNEDDGLSFDHLLGRCSEWTSVTVVAPNACDADALTKIVWAMGGRAAALLAAANAEAFAIRADGSLEPILEEPLAA